MSERAHQAGALHRRRRRGMSGIARVAHDQGMQVSGSDIKESRYTKQLRGPASPCSSAVKPGDLLRGATRSSLSPRPSSKQPRAHRSARRGLEIWHRDVERSPACSPWAAAKDARRGRHAR